MHEDAWFFCHCHTCLFYITAAWDLVGVQLSLLMPQASMQLEALTAAPPDHMTQEHVTFHSDAEWEQDLKLCALESNLAAVEDTVHIACLSQRATGCDGYDNEGEHNVHAGLIPEFSLC